jgi:hypothetical protein
LAYETAGVRYVIIDTMLKTSFTPDEIGKIAVGRFLRGFCVTVTK